MDDLKFGPPIRDVLPSPGGIPPWDPPDDQGELFAHQGWAEWVQEHGNTRERLQLFTYQCEQVGEALFNAIKPAVESAVAAINRFAEAYMKGIK